MKFVADGFWRDRTGTSIPVFLMSLPFGILGVFLPLYGRQLGASAVEIGVLFTAFSLTGVLVRPLVGIGADRFGRRPFVLVGAALYLLATLLFALSVSLPVLFAARLAQGLASALFWVAIYALLSDYGQGGARGRIFGHLAEASNAGAILGTVASYGAIVTLGIVAGWRLSFGAFAVTCGLALALFVRRIPAHTTSVRAPVVRPADRGTLLFLLSVSFVTAASYSLVLPIVLLYLQDRFQASEFLLGLAYAPAAIVYSTAPGRLGGLGDRWSRKGIMSVALLSSGLVSLLFPLAPSLLVLCLVWVLEAALNSAAIPAQDALVSELSGGDVRGRAYGFYAAATGLGMSVGPPAGGWLYDHAGHGWPFWINAIVLPVAAAFILWKLPASRRTSQSVAVTTGADRAPEVDSPA